MEWLVTLSIHLPPMLMANFSSLLEERPSPASEYKPEGMSRAFEVMAFRVPSEAEVKTLIVCWRDYFTQYYPHVNLSEPHVTPLSSD